MFRACTCPYLYLFKYILLHTLEPLVKRTWSALVQSSPCSLQMAAIHVAFVKPEDGLTIIPILSILFFELDTPQMSTRAYPLLILDIQLQIICTEIILKQDKVINFISSDYLRQMGLVRKYLGTPPVCFRSLQWVSSSWLLALDVAAIERASSVPTLIQREYCYQL